MLRARRLLKSISRLRARRVSALDPPAFKKPGKQIKETVVQLGDVLFERIAYLRAFRACGRDKGSALDPPAFEKPAKQIEQTVVRRGGPCAGKAYARSGQKGTATR